MGLKESECGHIGAMTIAGTLGCTIEAPAAAAYAVEPVGVEIINPKIHYSINKLYMYTIIQININVIERDAGKYR